MSILAFLGACLLQVYTLFIEAGIIILWRVFSLIYKMIAMYLFLRSYHAGRRSKLILLQRRSLIFCCDTLCKQICKMADKAMISTVSTVQGNITASINGRKNGRVKTNLPTNESSRPHASGRRGKNGVRMERIVRNKSTTIFLYSLNCLCKSAIIVFVSYYSGYFKDHLYSGIFEKFITCDFVPQFPFPIVLTPVKIESGLRQRFVDGRLKLKCYRRILRVIAVQIPSTTGHGLSQPKHRVRGD